MLQHLPPERKEERDLVLIHHVIHRFNFSFDLVAIYHRGPRRDGRDEAGTGVHEAGAQGHPQGDADQRGPEEAPYHRQHDDVSPTALRNQRRHLLLNGHLQVCRPHRGGQSVRHPRDGRHERRDDLRFANPDREGGQEDADAGRPGGDAGNDHHAARLASSLRRGRNSTKHFNNR